MMGTFEISGSEATKCRNVVMASAPSSMPSSIFISMTFAPPLTWSCAMDKALSNLPSLINLRNFADPVTLVRSPTFMNPNSLLSVMGSNPLNRNKGSISGGVRGLYDFAISANARMCAGVVPQHPPKIFTYPSSKNSLTCEAINSGDSSYAPISLGKPALG